jgi:hypothetical protein
MNLQKPNTSLTYFALTKLTPNTRYFMRVTSNNKNGQSTPSNVLVAITKPGTFLIFENLF